MQAVENKHLTTCDKCGKAFADDATIYASGYGVHRTNEGDVYLCYGCCANVTEADMIKTGKATLYLVHDYGRDNTLREGDLKCHWRMMNLRVTDWTGKLAFRVLGLKVSWHNMAGRRYDVCFSHDDKLWHGVQYGDNTQICHCKMLKS